LQPKVPRDLETVCLKCLEKERGRRYASALDLADDLHRFLNHEPVRARPASALYQFRKFARRNKALVGGVAAVFLARGLGVIGTGGAWARAEGERARARRAEEKERALLAGSYVSTARLALQRGAWRSAVENFDKALAAGHPDAVGLRLDRARAWYAVH